MITVPEVVEEIIRKSYLLEEGIMTGIINISSLARKIKSEVEEKTMKEVTDSSIIMALKRMKSHRFKVSESKPKSVLSKTMDIIVRSNLVEFTLNNSEKLLTNKKVFENFPLGKNYFFTITEGVFETAIIISYDLVGWLKKIFKQADILDEKSNLSAITIRLPETNVVTPGVYYHILKALAWENINVIDVVSTKSEFTIIFEDKNVNRAFSVLKKMINS